MNLEDEAKSKWDEAFKKRSTLKQAIRNALDEMVKSGLPPDSDPVPFILLHLEDCIKMIFEPYMNGCGDSIDLVSRKIWERLQEK